MNKATRAAAAVLGSYAGLLAVEHGIFEILQGNRVPEGSMIQAMGPSCQADAVWHACFPALTLIPSYLYSGIVVVLLGLAVLVCALVYAPRRSAGIALILLSAGLLPVGGGFVPVWIGVMAGIAATQIRQPVRNQRSGRWLRLLAGFWPWSVLALIIWFPGSWILGCFLPGFMLALSTLLFFTFDIVFPLLAAFSGVAYDRVKSRSLLPK